jgi:hypothetical protein
VLLDGGVQSENREPWEGSLNRNTDSRSLAEIRGAMGALFQRWRQNLLPTG